MGEKNTKKKRKRNHLLNNFFQIYTSSNFEMDSTDFGFQIKIIFWVSNINRFRIYASFEIDTTDFTFQGEQSFDCLSEVLGVLGSTDQSFDEALFSTVSVRTGLGSRLFLSFLFFDKVTVVKLIK